MHFPTFSTFSTPLARTAVLLLACASVATASSAMSLRELRTLAKTDKQGDNYVRYYLVGVMEGVLEAHAQDVRAGATPTICLNGRRLAPSMAKSLFDTELQRNEGLYEADMPAQWVMTQALATVYPC
ncbi:MAG: Rap1a/Tai family immunity protein [Rhodoferax sp.]|nr:Rap1a/Tai family immunity protein [Rhodoferax sp.]MDP3652538.1 Rap1a/Tai family immunity protein [Rhodoferax sp.]